VPVSDGEASGDGKVIVFGADDAELGEASVRGLAGTALPRISAGLPFGSLAGQLEQLVASHAVLPSNIFESSITGLSKTLEQIGRGPKFVNAISPASSSVARILAMDLKMFDRVSTDFVLAQRAHALTAAWSKDTFGLSAMTSWRTSLAIESTLSPLLRSLADAPCSQSFWAEDLLSVAAAQVKLTDWAVSQDAGAGLLGAISGKPLSLWRDYADLVPPQPDVQWLRTSVGAGRAGLGLLGADVMESDLEDTERVQAMVEQVELEVLIASEPGRLRMARDLYRRLGAIDPTVPELLEAAWENIERNGPAAASQAAHCIVEVLDRTLRAAAPEDAVREWHTRTKRSVKEFGDRGQMTRPLRVRYLASEIGGTKELVVAQYESLAGLLRPLHGRLEGVKHASTADVTLVRSLLLTAEGFLTLLFLSTVA
jgi:hypothetical protein